MPLPKGPEEIYGELFELVQASRVFSDSKTFVDATPLSDVASIMNAFSRVDHDQVDDVRSFVLEYFALPTGDDSATELTTVPAVRDRIEQLWDVLSRAADHVDPNSSLIELPRPYIVPGGRFREIYYWDSYFTMLGLAESGRFGAIEDMVDNFAFLIDSIGFIPNGNRSYFCTRSQPPFFVLMVELLAKVRDDVSIFQKYLPQLEREYAFWMSGAESLPDSGGATRRVVRIGDGYLNRYWDDCDTPRAESYAEDRQHAAASGRKEHEYYRNIRAACESGWDFSSRWLDASGRLESIRTTEILPVDLNALLYRLESCLHQCYEDSDAKLAASYAARARYRKHTLQTLFFDDSAGFFADLDATGLQPTSVQSLAAAFPLFLQIATPDQAAQVAKRIDDRFLTPGGWVTTLTPSGQQWDRPNGWAPLQWVVFEGLLNYGFTVEAHTGAVRWVENNLNIYTQTSKLLEKYDVDSVGTLATGGEYAVQDGFGWTNAVLLGFMNRLGVA